MNGTSLVIGISKDLPAARLAGGVEGGVRRGEVRSREKPVDLRPRGTHAAPDLRGVVLTRCLSIVIPAGREGQREQDAKEESDPHAEPDLHV